MISGPKPVPDNSEKESPYQYHIDFLIALANWAVSKEKEELEHPKTIAMLIFIRTTIRQKEPGFDEFAPLYDAAKEAIQTHLGIVYLRAWIEHIEIKEAQYAKKKPEPVDSGAQRKSSSDEVRDELSKYFNDIWKRLSAISFESVEKLNLTDLNEEEFPIYMVRAEPYNYGKHKEDNASIDLKTLIKKILGFIKKENIDLHARLETKYKNRLGEVKRRIHDADPSELDDWPEDKWFGLTNDGVPEANWPNVYFAVKRCKISVTYDGWTDEHIIQYKDAPPRSVKFDDMLPFLLEQFFNSFKFVPKEEQVKIALKIISQRPKNRVNSLLDRYAQFESLSSGDYDTDLKYLQDIGVQIWDCKNGPYEREVVRSIFIGHVQRAYYPGCFLQRMITLIGKGRAGKSTACQILAGNYQLADGKYGEENFTRVNVFVKSERDRYAALKGKAVHEYGERAKISSIDAAFMKNDITSTTEFVRRLFTDEGTYAPRWYDTICTVDKDEYGQDPEDRRDIGLRVGTVDLALFVQEYPKIMGAAIYLVKHNMSGVISDDVLDEAKRQHAISIVKNDLMEIVEPIFAFAHLTKEASTGYDL
jgi:Virulence-associated protein E